MRWAVELVTGALHRCGPRGARVMIPAITAIGVWLGAALGASRGERGQTGADPDGMSGQNLPAAAAFGGRAHTPQPYDAVMAGFGRNRSAAMAAAVAAATVLAAGCTRGSAQSSAPPASPGPAHARSAQAAPPAGARRRQLAARYLAIARAGNRRLDAEFGRLEGRDHARLTAAHRDLLQVAATERLFDQRLLGIAFPAATERIAQLLYRVNQARASMTAAAASSASLARLHAAERRLTQANKPVEQAVTIIRSQLGLPPPETS